jgi:SAM-dependent methyltransferase
LAKVLEVAQRHAGKMGVGDRYATIAGDAFTVDLKGTYDVVLLTNLLHHFSAEKCVTLLKRLRGAVKPGGKLVTLEFVPNEDRVTPPMPGGVPARDAGDDGRGRCVHVRGAGADAACRGV